MHVFARTALMVACTALPACSQADTPGNPKELGSVHWIRDLDAGLEQARKSGKPVFLQFQEVPG